MQLKDFVKHGKDSGFVEITLYDDKAPTHPVIRRSLSATSNSSEWTINRRSEQEKNVCELGWVWLTSDGGVLLVFR